MKPLRIATMLMALAFQNPAFSQNLVQNGGFENDFDGWERLVNDSSHLMISRSTVNSGSKALLVLGSDTASAWVQQVVNVPLNAIETSFWVYPASMPYKGWFSWAGTDQNGQGRHLTVLTFQDGTLTIESTLTHPDGTKNSVGDTIANVIVSNRWNKVLMQVSRAGLPHLLFVNDNLVSTLAASFSLTPVDHLGAGEPGSITYYGTLYLDDISITDAPTAIVPESSTVPAKFLLYQNFPNPFNPLTMIAYELPASMPVDLKIYNIQGQLVRTVVLGELPAGSHHVAWDATDDTGKLVASGVYVYRITAGKFTAQRKLVLMQ